MDAATSYCTVELSRFDFPVLQDIFDQDDKFDRDDDADRQHEAEVRNLTAITCRGYDVQFLGRCASGSLLESSCV